MQPNTFSGNYQPNNAAPVQSGMPLKPGVYYEIQSTSSNQKKHPGPVIAIIALSLLLIGAIAYITVDKINAAKTTTSETTPIASSNITTPLSSISLPENASADALKSALAGRIFTVDASYSQYIKFVSDTKYEFSYYRSPSTDYATVVASVDNGDYTVNNKTITLSNGDTFTIVNDYLVKGTSTYSKNQNTVYFDTYQFPPIMRNTTNAFASNISSWQQNNKPLAKVSTVKINHFLCTTSSSHLTSADAYVCDTDYTLYFDKTSVNTAIKTANLANFTDLCNSNADYQYYAANGGRCDNTDFSIANATNLIIRINADGYQIAGHYND